MLLRMVWYLLLAILFAGPAYVVFSFLRILIEKAIRIWRAIRGGEPSGDLLTDYGIRAIQEQLERAQDDH